MTERHLTPAGNPVLLVDMDGVLADLEHGFMQRWRDADPDAFVIPFAERREFTLERDYPPQYRERIRAVLSTPGFFEGLEPIDGAVDAVHHLLGWGWDVRLCTSPLSGAPHCASEKHRWVIRHLGAPWADRIITTKDKTVVRGCALIDDAPSVRGAMEPEWRHIVYDQPYNKTASTPWRLSWTSDWTRALEDALRESAVAAT